MQINSEKISAAINKINTDTTTAALKVKEAGNSPGKIKPFTGAISIFISSFFRNENKYKFRNRLINSVLMSFSEFVKYLKIRKLNSPV